MVAGLYIFFNVMHRGEELYRAMLHCQAAILIIMIVKVDQMLISSHFVLLRYSSFQSGFSRFIKADNTFATIVSALLLSNVIFFVAVRTCLLYTSSERQPSLIALAGISPELLVHGPFSITGPDPVSYTHLDAFIVCNIAF